MINVLTQPSEKLNVFNAAAAILVMAIVGLSIWFHIESRPNDEVVTPQQIAEVAGRGACERNVLAALQQQDPNKLLTKDSLWFITFKCRANNPRGITLDDQRKAFEAVQSQ